MLLVTVNYSVKMIRQEILHSWISSITYLTVASHESTVTIAAISSRMINTGGTVLARFFEALVNVYKRESITLLPLIVSSFYLFQFFFSLGRLTSF